MSLYAQPTEITSTGNSIADIGADVSDGARRGRSLEVTAPGLVTAEAFAAFRDTWLGEGERIGLDLDETGVATTQGSQDHTVNEDAIERGYDAIHPR